MLQALSERTVIREVPAATVVVLEHPSVLGEEEASTQITRMKERLAAREAGVHIRELYVATPTT